MYCNGCACSDVVNCSSLVIRSYTSFFYSDLVVSPSTVKAGTNVTVKVSVANTGQYDGDEVGVVK